MTRAIFGGMFRRIGLLCYDLDEHEDVIIVTHATYPWHLQSLVNQQAPGSIASTVFVGPWPLVNAGWWIVVGIDQSHGFNNDPINLY